MLERGFPKSQMTTPEGGSNYSGIIWETIGKSCFEIVSEVITEPRKCKPSTTGNAYKHLSRLCPSLGTAQK